MFEDSFDWSDLEENETEKPPKIDKNEAKISKKASTSSLESLKNGIKLDKLKSAVKRKFDKFQNSPSFSEKLLDSEAETPVKKAKSESGSILTQGIKFKSEQEFSRFMGKAKKIKKKNKDKGEKSEENVEKSDSGKKFNLPKLKELLGKSEEKKKKCEETKPEENSHKMKLQSAHFRHLNEQLYTQTGSQSLKMFKKDPESFKIYHDGFQSQAKKWPVDPLDKIITSILKISGRLTIADFGCGEARLAKSLKDEAEVFSFDLVKINDLVTVCDFAATPLKDEQCDIVVFCLSLMGTNLKDFIKEANRVLKMNGTLKIAEVVSRFKDLTFEEFLQNLTKYGFQLKWKDESNSHFYLADLKKVSTCKKKVPEFGLKPCLYKKR